MPYKIIQLTVFILFIFLNNDDITSTSKLPYEHGGVSSPELIHSKNTVRMVGCYINAIFKHFNFVWLVIVCKRKIT